jgi:hypothetical protein
MNKSKRLSNTSCISRKSNVVKSRPVVVPTDENSMCTRQRRKQVLPAVCAELEIGERM